MPQMNCPSPPVELNDIAKRLGIAVSTVSRALRDLPGIHPATRAKIVREAEALGYVALRKRNDEAVPQLRNILVLTLGVDDTHGVDEAHARYLAGMSRAGLAFNFSLLSHVCFSHEESHDVLNPKYQPASLRMGLVA